MRLGTHLNSKAFIQSTGQIWFKTQTLFSDAEDVRKVFFLFILSTLVCVDASAQLDPLLIAPSAGTPTNPEEVDSRYTIRNRPANTVTNPLPQVTPTPPASKKNPPKSVKEVEVVVPSPTAVVNEQGGYEDIPYDIKKNLVEVQTEAFIVYNDSNSFYKFRDYNTFAQGLGVGVDVWVTPDIGIETSYKTTVNATMNGLDHSTQLKYSETWIDFAIEIRSEFEAARSPYFITKLGYSDHQKKTPIDNVDRATLRTTGPIIEFETFLPTSNTQVWNLSLEVNPFQTHKEKAVGANLGSGDRAKTWLWGVGVGSRTVFNRKYQFNWSLDYSCEKIVFDGASRQANPWPGTTLTDVSIMNSLLFFNIGFVWGG